MNLNLSTTNITFDGEPQLTGNEILKIKNKQIQISKSSRNKPSIQSTGKLPNLSLSIGNSPSFTPLRPLTQQSSNRSVFNLNQENVQLNNSLMNFDTLQNLRKSQKKIRQVEIKDIDHNIFGINSLLSRDISDSGEDNQELLNKQRLDGLNNQSGFEQILYNLTGYKKENLYDDFIWE